MTFKDKVRNQFDHKWWKLLESEFDKGYVESIHRGLNTELDLGNSVYPKPEDVYSPFKEDYDEIKIVILVPTPLISYGKSRYLSKISQLIDKDCFGDLEVGRYEHLGHLNNQGIMILPTALTCENDSTPPHTMGTFYKEGIRVFKR